MYVCVNNTLTYTDLRNKITALTIRREIRDTIIFFYYEISAKDSFDFLDILCCDNTDKCVLMRVPKTSVIRDIRPVTFSIAGYNKRR